MLKFLTHGYICSYRYIITSGQGQLLIQKIYINGITTTVMVDHIQGLGHHDGALALLSRSERLQE